MNRRKFLGYMGCGCCSIMLPSCATAPITERRQLKLINEAKLNAHASKIYEKIKECKTVFLNPAWKQIVSYFDESFLNTSKIINCSIGDMLIFPSYLEHYVKRHDEESITISGNIRVNINKK